MTIDATAVAMKMVTSISPPTVIAPAHGAAIRELDTERRTTLGRTSRSAAMPRPLQLAHQLRVVLDRGVELSER